MLAPPVCVVGSGSQAVCIDSHLHLQGGPGPQKSGPGVLSVSVSSNTCSFSICYVLRDDTQRDRVRAVIQLIDKGRRQQALSPRYVLNPSLKRNLCQWKKHFGPKRWPIFLGRLLLLPWDHSINSYQAALTWNPCLISWRVSSLNPPTLCMAPGTGLVHRKC